MVGLIEYTHKGLRKFANFQIKHVGIIVLLVLALTAFSAVGLTKIYLESDFDTLNPQDLPPIVLDNKIGIDFQEFESVVIVVELDDSLDDKSIQDIRDPEVIEFMKRLQENLESERTIQNVQSVGMIFSQMDIPENIGGMKNILKNVPGSEKFFDDGFEMTVAMIEADVGGDTDKIQALDEKVNNIIAASSKPGGIKVTTTGDAPLGSAIFRLLINDAFFTMVFSIIAIFILIVVLEASIKRGLIVLLPLLLGMIWTAGTLGWLGIPITIATAGLSAMLLGLGMEYSIFLVSRYNEERRKHDLAYSISESVVEIGGSLTASGGTTIIGFWALTLSAFPMLAGLGASLAIGIAFMLVSTLVAGPAILILEDRIEKRLKGEKEIKHEEEIREKEFKKLKIEKVYRGYGKIVANKPWTIFSISIAITVIMIYGITLVETQDIDFETVLPADLEEMVAFKTLTNEFGETSSILIYVEVSPEFANSDEPKDIRDPRVLEYVDRLTQKARFVQDVEEVNSISQVVKDSNDGIIPKTIASEREVFEGFQAKDLINQDYSATLIRITTNDEAIKERKEITNQIYELMSETERPAGVDVKASGELIVETELDAVSEPDSQKTSLISLVGIIVFLYVLTRSVKNTFLPLVTVVLGVIWTLGLGGIFGIPSNNITTSVVTMIIGIGIDFGLQIMLRFDYELKKNEKKKAMEETMANVLTPMVITVVAALIGFSAMNFGQLKLMGDLGIMMGFGVAGSMLAAITGVAALYVLFKRETRREDTVGHKSLKAHKRSKNMRNLVFFSALAAVLIVTVGTVSATVETVSLSDYIVDFEYNEEDVVSGETFLLTATVTNDAGETRENAEISLDLDSPFDTIGGDTKNLGTLEDEESKTVSFRIEVDDSTSSDEYAINFDMKDNEEKDSDEFIVTVESNVAKLIIGNVKSLPATISPDLNEAKIIITLENIEDENAEFVRAKLKLPEGFSSSGSYTDSANLGTIAAGESKDVEFFIDTAKIVSSGIHKGVLELEYNEDGDGKKESLEFDLPVKGRPQFQIIESYTSPAKVSENSDASLSIKIENIGEEEGKETSIRVFENSDQPFNFEEKTNFIGDLAPGESGIGTLKFSVDSGAVEKEYLVRVQVRTVSEGNVLVEEMTIPLKVGGAAGRNNVLYYAAGFGIILLIVLGWLIFRKRKI